MGDRQRRRQKEWVQRRKVINDGGKRNGLIEVYTEIEQVNIRRSLLSWLSVCKCCIL